MLENEDEFIILKNSGKDYFCRFDAFTINNTNDNEYPDYYNNKYFLGNGEFSI